MKLVNVCLVLPAQMKCGFHREVVIKALAASNSDGDSSFQFN